MFDVLTYQKGCAVLRMLEQHLGPEPFRRGISRYLAEHAHANTETSDLWDAIEAASEEPAGAVMNSWILQGGYPVVSVATDDGRPRVRLGQRRFRYLATAGDEAEPRWQVPIALRASVGGEVVRRRLLFTEPDTTVDLPGAPDWVVVNEGGWGFYRVRYGAGLLAPLLADPQANLSVVERFNLVADTWASTLAGFSTVADFTHLAGLFGEESDPDLWAVLLAPLRLFDKVVGETGRPRLEAFARRLAGPAFERVGWSAGPDEAERVGQLRAILLGALGTLGNDEPVRERCRQLHQAYLDDRAAVAPDLVDTVLAVVADSGGQEEYEQFLDRFRQPGTPQEELRYLYGLGRFPDAALVDRTLALCLTDEVRTQNAPYLVGQMLGGRRQGAAAWRFVQDHWDLMCERFPDNSIPRMVEGLAGQASPERTAEAKAFFADHPVPQGELLVRQTLERMEVNAAFAEAHGAEVATALE